MRKLLLLLNFILILALAAVVLSIWNFKKSPRDKILDWKPQISERTYTQRKKTAPVQLNVIRSKNIFSPDRGHEVQGPESANGRKNAPPKFELVGICSIGDQAGAIIDVKTVGTSNTELKKKRYFAIGEEVFDGFKLETIAEKSAVITRNNETLEIKIEGTRFAAEVGKSKVPRPISPPSGAPTPTQNQPQRLINSQPGGQSPPPVTVHPKTKPPGA